MPPSDRTWFHRTFGFEESADYETTQRHLLDMLQNETLLKKPDGTILDCGTFELISLEDMRHQCQALKQRLLQVQHETSKTVFGPITCSNITSDAYALHGNPIIGDNGIIQAASQFNCLEFPSPRVVPEDGITNYCHDRTQGPACAIACGAGTAYRNYLVPMKEHDTIGQRKRSQINTLHNILQTLQSYRPDTPLPITVKNGYANAKSAPLHEWNETIQAHADELRNLLQIGIQRDTQVTAILPNDDSIRVTQVYASAVPVAYSKADVTAWEPMARIVLEGCYELTLLTGVRKALEKALMKQDTSPTRIFLTLVGGGVFGNDLEWIWSAIDRAHRVVAVEYGVALEIYFVHYSETPPQAKVFVERWNSGGHHATTS